MTLFTCTRQDLSLLINKCRVLLMLLLLLLLCWVQGCVLGDLVCWMRGVCGVGVCMCVSSNRSSNKVRHTNVEMLGQEKSEWAARISPLLHRWSVHLRKKTSCSAHIVPIRVGCPHSLRQSTESQKQIATCSFSCESHNLRTSARMTSRRAVRCAAEVVTTRSTCPN